jgi:DNA-binding MarR family transcriptional regulator
MEQETLYTSTKWEILKLLETKKRSPIELAEQSNTSVANISQSLRFLELGGLVKSERISNRDKGQPRVNYSLADNNTYLITAAPNFVNKKKLILSPTKKIILKIWFLQDEYIQYYVEKAFWHIEGHLPQIKALLVNKRDYSAVSFLIATDHKDFKISSFSVRGEETKQVKVKIIKTDDAKKLSATELRQYYVLHDPKNLFGGKKEG